MSNTEAEGVGRGRRVGYGLLHAAKARRRRRVRQRTRAGSRRCGAAGGLARPQARASAGDGRRAAMRSVTRTARKSAMPREDEKERRAKMKASALSAGGEEGGEAAGHQRHAERRRSRPGFRRGGSRRARRLGDRGRRAPSVTEPSRLMWAWTGARVKSSCMPIQMPSDMPERPHRAAATKQKYARRIARTFRCLRTAGVVGGRGLRNGRAGARGGSKRSPLTSLR